MGLDEIPNKIAHLSYLGESRKEKANLFWGLSDFKKAWHFNKNKYLNTKKEKNSPQMQNRLLNVQSFGGEQLIRFL